ncbi:hypothetical protein DRH29_00490 [candidate division Kazan bacterium]|uniref:Uncharacterized protein n=1 Tax=candidate division Kazan bacterium TaxID=2202143 RepID=A0A420ZDX2_UNCK3|nr:MAG: hypothetical protein DRH29_00490 [candidate division Kazan bacterium]
MNSSDTGESGTLNGTDSVRNMTAGQMIRQKCEHEWKKVGEKEKEGGIFYCPCCGAVRIKYYSKPTSVSPAES